MKILEDAPTPNARRVRIFLAEKGVDIPFEQLSIMDREHQTEAFTALNPYNRVPVLILDDQAAISETMAICRYFEALKPDPSLFGRSPDCQGRIEMWNRRCEQQLFFHISQHFRHINPKMAPLEDPQIPQWGEINGERVAYDLQVLESQLTRHPFVSGDSFSVADITAAIAINFLKPAKLTLDPKYENITRWFNDMKRRPSWDA